MSASQQWIRVSHTHSGLVAVVWVMWGQLPVSVDCNQQCNMQLRRDTAHLNMEQDVLSVTKRERSKHTYHNDSRRCCWFFCAFFTYSILVFSSPDFHPDREECVSVCLLQKDKDSLKVSAEGDDSVFKKVWNFFVLGWELSVTFSSAPNLYRSQTLVSDAALYSPPYCTSLHTTATTRQAVPWVRLHMCWNLIVFI